LEGSPAERPAASEDGGIALIRCLQIESDYGTISRFRERAWSRVVQFTPEWIGSIVGIVSVVGGALWWAIRTYIDNRHLRREVKELDEAVTERDKRIDHLASKLEEIADVKAELKRTRTDNQRILATGNQLVEVYKDLKRRTHADLEKLAQDKELAEDEIRRIAERNEEFSQQIHELEEQIDAVKTQDGRLWQRPVADSAPKFRPILERGFPIISVLNLKGGVGKTTITAHLAGMLGLKKNRVLSIDCDYQRSLSMMVVPAQQRTILSLERRCLQHFLAGQEHSADDLLACRHEIGTAMPGCSIVTNSDSREKTVFADSLEETENRLMAEWTVRKIAEIRLSLREALHAPELTRKFDYVLLDCPPRLTTACVNALAASDYVLIPVVPDALSARAVPELLHTLKDLRSSLLGRLSVLGVVANLATLREGKMTEQEWEVWNNLEYGLTAAWGAPVHFFKTPIPDKSAFGRAAGSVHDGEVCLAFKDDSIHKCFSQLVSEIEKEIRSHERSHASAVLA
jgi:cellulose biosynthesis protein BcsQ/chaperonin cofactor prefoldin